MKHIVCLWSMLLQWTWGLPQSLLGLLLLLRFRKKPRRRYLDALMVDWGLPGGISLGFVFFTGHPELAPHEYGHTRQSLLLGPLYLAVIGLPSLLWANLPYFRRLRREKNIPYSRLYCESWADRWGKTESAV
ncbi:MAG: hypothetical protein ACOX17_08930 [Christensenellales bacterium]|jgi:hypothetical protein